MNSRSCSVYIPANDSLWANNSYLIQLIQFFSQFLSHLRNFPQILDDCMPLESRLEPLELMIFWQIQLDFWLILLCSSGNLDVVNLTRGIESVDDKIHHRAQCIEVFMRLLFEVLEFRKFVKLGSIFSYEMSIKVKRNIISLNKSLILI